jgi:hypothetical protein
MWATMNRSAGWYWSYWLSFWQAALLAGITPWQRVLSKFHARERLLPRRMAVLGLDPEAFARREAATFRELSEGCGACAKSAQCEWDLMENPTDSAWQEYCPDAKRLVALSNCARRGTAAD